MSRRRFAQEESDSFGIKMANPTIGGIDVCLFSSSSSPARIEDLRS
jgi:hypothetical protein